MKVLKKINIYFVFYLLIFLLLINNFTSYQGVAKDKKEEEKDLTGYKRIPFPRFYEGHYNNGYKYLQKKNYKVALEEFGEALVIKPDYYQAYMGLGDTYKAMKNYKKAIENYKKGIEIINPIYLNKKLLQAEDYEESGNLIKAAETYRYILTIEPKAGFKVLLGNKYIKLSLKKNPKKEANEKATLEKNAIKAYQEAYKIDPKYADAYFKVGNIYYEITNNIPNAIKEYTNAVKYLPTEPIYNYQLGLAYFKKAKKTKKINEQDLDEAIKYLELALSYNHDNKNLFFNLGNAYLDKALIKHSEIPKTVKEIDKIKKDIEKIETEIEKIKVEMFKKEKTIDRQPDMLKIKEKRKEIENLNKKMGEPLAKIDQISSSAMIFYDKAINMYQQSIKINVKDSDVYYNLGNAYCKKGELVHSTISKYETYGKELKANEVWKKTHYLYDMAIKSYKTALKTNPKYAEVYYDMGVVYYNKFKLKPDPNNLDIPKSLEINYATGGIKYYYDDMSARAIKFFQIYKKLKPKANNVKQVDDLISTIDKEFAEMKIKRKPIPAGG